MIRTVPWKGTEGLPLSGIPPRIIDHGRWSTCGWSYYVRGYPYVNPAEVVTGWELAFQTYQIRSGGYFDFVSILPECSPHKSPGKKARPDQ